MHVLFKQLFECYFDQLLKYAYRYVNDWSAAEDIVQEVFLSLWMKREEIDINQPIKPYLYKATYNRSLNYIASYYTQKRVDQSTYDDMIGRLMMRYNQYDNLLAKEINEELSICINALPPQCKKVFNLSSIEGLKNREISNRLKISEKTVEKHISRALTELRKHLLERGLLPILLFLFC